MLLEGPVRLKAVPNNGYRFVGWYAGEYLGGSDQAMQPKEPLELLGDASEYAFTLDAPTCVIPIFKQSPVVNFVDIGNVWTTLDPINEVPFTGEVNPDEEGLANFIELADERWSSAESTISKDASGVPVVGQTYTYTAVINAVGDNTFDPDNGFTFVYGGTRYDLNSLSVSYSNGNKTVEIRGFVPNQTVALIDISKASVSGVAAKTYTGKPQTQDPVVKMDVNGTPITLVKGQDYSVAYKNNTNAGTASVVVSGTGSYSGTATKGFTINKAPNPLSVKGKTAAVKYSKLGKKAQSLAVTKVIKFAKKGQGAMTYTKAKGNKKISINKKTGKVTVKKGLKKGTYSVKVKVKAAGNSNYKASGVKMITFKVKVK